MKRYQYILLDWDGNLAKTLDVWLEACRIAIEKRGVQRTDEEIGASFGAFAQHMETWGIKDVDAALSEADILAAKHLPNVELYPDALEVLEYLHKKHKKLALITTSSHAEIDHLLEKYNLNQLFAAMVTGKVVTHRKPHPEPLEMALQQLGGNKDEAIMIGDSDKDLGAAQNAGIDSVLFYPPEHNKFYQLESLRNHNPTYIIQDFRELMKIIK